MDWFRLYHNILDDPKIMGLPADVYRFWTMLLCMASRNLDWGSLPPLPEIAFQARVSPEQAQVYVDALVACKLLARDRGGKLSPHKWHEYQSKDTGAARARRHRAKAAAARAGAAVGGAESPPVEPPTVADADDGNVTRNVTGHVTPNGDCALRHVTVTRQREERERIGMNEGKEETLLSSIQTKGDARGDRPPPPAEAAFDHQTCVEAAMELFGDAAANAVASGRAGIARKIEGADGRPRWDALAAGLRNADRIRRSPGSEPIGNVVGLALSLAAEYIVTGEIPPDPVGAEAIEPAPAPSRSQRVYQEQRAAIRRMAEADRAAKGGTPNVQG